MPEALPLERRPWHLHPSLTEERLRCCARLLATARRDAIALAAYEMGDDNWSVGCRAYAFSRHRLRRVAMSREYPWLRIVEDGFQFVFLVDQVPVRFYRGSASEPTTRVLRRHELEAQQLELAFGPMDGRALIFRIAVETSDTGSIERVVFLALRGDEGHAECVWPIPLAVAAEAHQEGVQLRLIVDDGYAGPASSSARRSPRRSAVTRRPAGLRDTVAAGA